MSSGRKADLKIAWAEKRLAELQAAVDTWARAQKPAIIDDHDPDTGWHRYRVQALPDGPTDWVMMLGEIANHLRSALNYMVVGLVDANNGKVNTGHQFPIYSTSNDQGMARCLAGVADTPRDIIKEMQPYQRANRTQREPLEIIAELSNVDKHTDLRAIGFVTGSSNQPIVLKVNAPIEIVVHGMEPPLTPGGAIESTYLATMQVTPPDVPVPMEMENVAVEVVFRGAVDVPTSWLPGLSIEVRAIVDRLRGFL